ncbi:MAG: hypothetical protein PPP58_11075 [Natronomonas sp.]
MANVSRDGPRRRAAAPVVGYVLTLGITTILITGLLIAGGGFLDTEREQTVESELQAIGQQVSADIATADRLARAGSDDSAVQRQLPEQTVGGSYTIEIHANGGETFLELRSTAPSVTVEIGLSVDAGRLNDGAQATGGLVVAEFDAGTGEVVVRNG